MAVQNSARLQMARIIFSILFGKGHVLKGITYKGSNIVQNTVAQKLLIIQI